MTTEGPIQIAASADDAHEKNDSTEFTSVAPLITILGSNTSSFRFNGGFRFNSVDIAPGDTIDAVDLELFRVFFGHVLNATISANDVDDAVDFSTDPDVTTRINSASTSASSVWLNNGFFSGFISSGSDGIDLNSVVQEIIDRGGWVSGSDLVMLVAGFTGVGRGGATFSARAYDGTPSESARITIDFTAAGGPPPALSSRRLLSGTGR